MTTSTTREKLNELTEVLVEARALTDTFSALADGAGDPPAWTFVVARLVDRIGHATGELEVVLNARGLLSEGLLPRRVSKVTALKPLP